MKRNMRWLSFALAMLMMSVLTLSVLAEEVQPTPTPPAEPVLTLEGYNGSLLTMEKEVLGIYLSGHPLEQYRSMMEKNVSAWTSDFQPDEESGLPKVTDGQIVVLGGMISDKTVKYTKNNKVMAFVTLEDLVGTIEVVVFPKHYEKYQALLEEDARVLIQGRVSAEDDRASKLILEQVYSFADVPKELWIQFQNVQEYMEKERELLADLREMPGESSVVIYLKEARAMKTLPETYRVQTEDFQIKKMKEKYGNGNVKVVERVLKNLKK